VRGAWLRRQEGISLLEVLVASALMATISLAVTLAYSSMRVAQAKDGTSFDGTGAIRNAAQLIANDLRQAAQVNTATDCALGNENTLSFTDPDGNAVTYQLSGTNLTRSISGGTAETVTYPVSTLTVCMVAGAGFPTYRFTVANADYTLTMTVVARLMPNSGGVTME